MAISTSKSKLPPLQVVLLVKVLFVFVMVKVAGVMVVVVVVVVLTGATLANELLGFRLGPKRE